MLKLFDAKLRLRHLLEFDPGVHFVRPMLMSIGVGVGTGFLVVGFVKLIEIVSTFFFNPGIANSLWVIGVPVIGGLIVGPLVVFLAPEAKGHGVPEVLKALVLRGGKIRPIVVVVKAFASVVSIGAGFSVGREGPIVQIGAAFGSGVGQLLRLSQMRLKNLVACGAAAGIAGVFNTPIAGVMFASEVILRDFGANALSTVVVAAVSSSVISRIFLGDHPSFIIPQYNFYSPFEIFLYFGLGILSALTAVFFVTTLEKMETLFEQWRFPDWLKPACGGLAIGLIGYFFPQIFGSGLAAIEDALHGTLSLHLVFILIFIKILATSVSLGAGSSGGVFAPLLFIGAMMGGAFGMLLSNYLPVVMAPSGAYALVGMASVFSAAAHAPITSILIVFELTGSYGMILPIMVAVVTATSIAQTILKDSIYLGKLKRKGIDVVSFEESRILEGLQVNEAMIPDFEVVEQKTPVRHLIDLASRDMTKTILVVDAKKRLCGSIRPMEMNKILLSENMELLNAYDVASPVKEYVFPEESLNEVARVMASQHLAEMPVVDSLDTTRILGILRSEDIFRVYADHFSKREEILAKVVQDKDDSSGMTVMIFTVATASGISGKLIKDLNLPPGVHFNMLKRGGQFLIPHGNMTMSPKDRVTAVVMPQSLELFRRWLKDHKLKD